MPDAQKLDIDAVIAHLGRLAQENADLELDNEGLSRHVALMARHRMGEARLAAAARALLARTEDGVQRRPCPFCHGPLIQHQDQCPLEALRRLVAGQPQEETSDER